MVYTIISSIYKQAVYRNMDSIDKIGKVEQTDRLRNEFLSFIAFPHFS